MREKEHERDNSKSDRKQRIERDREKERREGIAVRGGREQQLESERARESDREKERERESKREGGKERERGRVRSEAAAHQQSPQRPVCSLPASSAAAQFRPGSRADPEQPGPPPRHLRPSDCHTVV